MLFLTPIFKNTRNKAKNNRNQNLVPGTASDGRLGGA